MKREKSKKGFTLIEVLVAILVFTIVMAMLSGSFSSFLKNYANQKKIQKDIENAQYAMNLMSKTLRTSYLSTTTFPLNTYDYSRNLCVAYRYTSRSIRIGSTNPGTSGDPTSCNYGNISSYANLTSGIIQSASVSAVATQNGTLGKVTISLSIANPTQIGAAIPIQMSVSLRQ
jgi:prepilin-type N-terminal cleavage/methylation domain-containing protein